MGGEELWSLKVLMHLTDEQWRVVVSEFFPRRKGGGRRGRLASRLRPVLEGILWALRSGAPWQDLPQRFPPHQTCHRWYVRWAGDGTLERILALLAADVEARGGVDIRSALGEALQVLENAPSGAWVPPPAPSGPRPWQHRTAQTLAAVLILRIAGRKT